MTETEMKAIHQRLDDGDERMARIEKSLAVNTEATQQVAANTLEMVDLFLSFKGAFKVLDGLGKLAKPMASILAFGAACAAAWAAFKGVTR